MTTICHHFLSKHCRSCEKMETQTSVRLHEAESRIAAILGINPMPSFQGPLWGFRDKIKLTVSGTVTHPTLGLLLPDLSSGIELLDCPVQASALNQELPSLLKFITKWNLIPYHIPTKRGELKGLILSWSPTTGEKMIRFVLRSKESLDRIRLGLEELKSFSVVSVNLQPVPHAILEGDKEIILSSKKFISHQTLGPTLFFSPQSFMQTNSAVASALYATSMEWLKPWGNKKALDLYCGAGGFALHMASKGMQVKGVERNPAAISVAGLASVHNKLSVEFFARDAEGIETLWTQWNPEIVVVNPPRRGLGDTLDLIETHLPEVLLYSSCSADSFELDMKRLKTHYDASSSMVFDMFPYTNHFEVLTLLVRRSGRHRG